MVGIAGAASSLNQAPNVEAGDDLFLWLPDSEALLAGSITDDGQGHPEGYLHYRWSWLEGPGPVLFEPNAFALEPAVILEGGPGVYVLELSATDGDLSAADQVTIYLNEKTDVASIVINEILALAAPESPEQADWIELFNAGDQPVDVAGYYLTDDPGETTRWRIPSGHEALTTIPANGYLRIWADAGTGAGLHATFQLDSGGESLGLYAPDGRTPLDSVTYGRLPAGLSWGRQSDGGEPWVSLHPSPNQSNAGNTLPLVADTKFSIDRGFFDTPFVVTITCATEGATIVYTTDGSTPTPYQGNTHASPATVAITTTTVLRAMAHRTGMHPTDVDAQTYIFLSDVIRQPAVVPGYPNPRTWLGGSHYDTHDYEMDPFIVDHPDYRDEIIPALTAIPTMSIAVEPSALADENGFYWGGGETACSMELIFPDDPNENVQINAGIEPHSHDRMKRSLRLNFRSRYGDAKLKTSLIQKGSLYGASATDTFDRLILRGGNNRCWARTWNPDKTTYAVDQFYRDSQVALSGYGSRGAFVHLYINGLYWGLYNPVERTDQWFTSAYFGGEPEEWFAVHHGSSSRPGFNGDSTRYRILMNDLISRDQRDPATYATTSHYLDAENFCDYMLFTWWMGVGDWPKNNWYAGCRTDLSPAGPTPLRFFAWDGEWSWDASRAGGPGYVHPDFRADKTGGSSPIPQIWHALRRNDDFMTLFADRVYRHFYNDGPLTESVAQERWLGINEQIRSAVVAESARWGDAMQSQGHPTRTRNQDWNREVDAIYDMIAGNSRQFLTYLRQQGYYPEIDPPVFSQRGGALSPDQTLQLTNPNGSGTVYYTLDDSDPRPISAPLQESQGTHARAALGPVRLLHSCTVKTRVQDGPAWSALNQATFALGPVLESLRISELMYHPGGSDSLHDPNTEFIELTNTGVVTINLNLVRFIHGVSFTFPPYDLGPGDSVVLAQDLAAFRTHYGMDLPVLGPYSGKLSNAGEHIELADALGRTILDFTFDDGWYRETDGQGYSLEVRDPANAVDLGDEGSWQRSHGLGGTPGS
jgi:hypothetical protein